MYGVDEGIGLDDDSSRVEVQQTTEILSSVENANLDEIMCRMNPSGSLSEVIPINQFTTARAFVHSCTNAYTNSP